MTVTNPRPQKKGRRSSEKAERQIQLVKMRSVMPGCQIPDRKERLPEHD